jgi:hypothetical protein
VSANHRIFAIVRKQGRLRKKGMEFKLQLAALIR